MAVLVAEDITTRFLNVISLFNKAIPIIAIQINALEVGDHLTLNATTALDLMRPGTEEEDEPGQPVDRTYWESRGSPAAMAMLDDLHRLIQEVTCDQYIALKYNKAYIGLARNGVADNFMTFQPREGGKLFTRFGVERSKELESRLDGGGARRSNRLQPPQSPLLHSTHRGGPNSESRSDRRVDPQGRRSRAGARGLDPFRALRAGG